MGTFDPRHLPLCKALILWQANLEKEVQREKALAEAAALLLLRKKAQAIWGDPEEE